MTAPKTPEQIRAEYAESRVLFVQYTREYHDAVWPNLKYREPTADEVEDALARADFYADAHVEGEHEANGICRFVDAWECALRSAAAEFVECS